MFKFYTCLRMLSMCKCATTDPHEGLWCNTGISNVLFFWGGGLQVFMGSRGVGIAHFNMAKQGVAGRKCDR